MNQKIRKRISRTPVLIHGTAVESVTLLFERDKLPPGRYRRRGGNAADKCSGRIYCATVKSSFRGEKEYGRISRNLTRNGAIEWATGYARSRAIEEYLRKITRIERGLTTTQEEWVITLEDYKSCASFTSGEIMTFLRDFRLKNYGEERGRKMLDAGLKRKGVLIELNRMALELRHGIPRRMSSYEFYIKCPNGLSMKYISAIHPIGVVDRQLLQPYLN